MGYRQWLHVLQVVYGPATGSTPIKPREVEPGRPYGVTPLERQSSDSPLKSEPLPELPLEFSGSLPIRSLIDYRMGPGSDPHKIQPSELGDNHA